MAEAGQANLSLLKLASLARALRVSLAELCDLNLASAPELRVALLGVRGCGKSTVGRELARQLEVPFVELDELIEAKAGLPLTDVFSIHGDGYYRTLQREALESWLAQHGSGVLATGGSIVNDEATYLRLRETCRTVWLRATAEEHWCRVVGQGDLRPMQDRPRAMLELRKLLEARDPLYSSADHAVDTMDNEPPTIASQIGTWLLG
jgi:XRE family aerobic/anaerobic benzoate catabolism transcriptional regulator